MYQVSVGIDIFNSKLKMSGELLLC